MPSQPSTLPRMYPFNRRRPLLIWVDFLFFFFYFWGSCARQGYRVAASRLVQEGQGPPVEPQLSAAEHAEAESEFRQGHEATPRTSPTHTRTLPSKGTGDFSFKADLVSLSLSPFRDVFSASDRTSSRRETPAARRSSSCVRASSGGTRRTGGMSTARSSRGSSRRARSSTRASSSGDVALSLLLLPWLASVVVATSPWSPLPDPPLYMLRLAQLSPPVTKVAYRDPPPPHLLLCDSALAPFSPSVLVSPSCPLLHSSAPCTSSPVADYFLTYLPCLLLSCTAWSVHFSRHASAFS